MDLQRAIETFQLYMSANGYSRTTQELYNWALGLLCEYLENPQLKAIKAADLDHFWSWLRNDYQPKRTNGKTHPLAGRSLENVWTAERSFFKWCEESGRLRKRPDLHIRRSEYAERIVEPLTEDEVNRLIEAAQRTRIANTKKRTPFTMPRSTAKRDTALIMLLADTGMRASECARLTRADIDFDQSTVTIQAWGTGRKTKQRTLDIGRNTRLALWEYLIWREDREGQAVEPDDFVFRSLCGNPMNKDSIRQVLADIGESAGIPNVHPHRFRHFYASQMAADDMTEFNLMENLGQTSNKMARRYVHLSRTRHKKTSECGRQDCEKALKPCATH